MIEDAEKELQIPTLDEMNYYGTDLTCRAPIEVQYEKENKDWKKALEDERKRRKQRWKEEEENRVLDHRQREEDLHYPREYLVYMKDRFKDDIGSVRRFELRKNKTKTTWKDKFNIFGKWQEINKVHEPIDSVKVFNNKEESNSKNKCSETVSKQENWNLPLESGVKAMGYLINIKRRLVDKSHSLLNDSNNREEEENTYANKELLTMNRSQGRMEVNQRTLPRAQ
jgi:hypothetical protein